MPIGDLIPWRREQGAPARREEQEHPLTSFRREMNQLFDEFFGGERALAPFGEGWGAFNPQVDVAET